MKTQGNWNEENQFQIFLNSDKIYSPLDILDVLHRVRHHFRFSYTSQKTRYFDVPCSFDIETSSFYRMGMAGEREKVGIMYEWTFGIYGLVIVGRTYDEFMEMLNTLSTELKLNDEKRLIIYVHNLSYEFQFIRKYFNWTKVFSLENRKVIYGVTSIGCEFRCSYILSNLSLEKVGINLIKYKVLKLVDNLDYSQIRHSKTPLTDDELRYCVNDVKVVMAYIAECIEQDIEISRIPLTCTGYVRNYCRKCCLYGESKKDRSSEHYQYKRLIKSLKLSSDEYQYLKEAFQGGFTHANYFYANKILTDVTSFDFTSSYPAVMVAEQFPMGSAEVVNITSEEQFKQNLNCYCCLFEVIIYDLEPVLWQESYISLSRCRDIIEPVVNNGRILKAKQLRTTITEQDYIIISKFYKWSHIKIGNFRRYKKGYLPTEFVSAILKLYRDKTSLKGIEDKLSEYMRSKGMINSCYGMTVTDIVRPEIIYDGEWEEPERPNLDEAIEKYNKNTNRFLFYPWGVWVTAYARRNIFTGIKEFGEDYVYSDTDSIKVLNADKHITYINNYNDTIQKQLFKAMNYHGLDKSLIEPETIKGVKKPLGVWDYDGHYSHFKTLGAKRYLVKYSDDIRNGEDAGKISLTVSGLDKKQVVPWMIKKWGESNVFEHFTNNMKVPAKYTGKLTHTYIDTPLEGKIVDYLGYESEYHEKSCIHLEPAEYNLSIDSYLSFISDAKLIIKPSGQPEREEHK